MQVKDKNYAIIQVMDFSAGSVLATKFKNSGHHCYFGYAVFKVDVEEIGDEFMDCVKEFNGHALYPEEENGEEWNELYKVFSDDVDSIMFHNVKLEKYLVTDSKYIYDISKLYEDHNIVAHYNIFLCYI